MAESGLQLVDGLVTHVIDPSNFFLRLGQDEHMKSFHEFENYLNNYCQHVSPAEVENINVGSNVLAKSSKRTRRGDNQWRRATVFRVDREKDKCDVFYVDFGNSENVAVRNIITALPPDVFLVPCLCVPCGLAGIMPLAGSWTSRGVKTFEQLVKGKKFKVIIHTFDQSRMYRTVAMYHGSNGKSLVDDLLEAEVGLPTREDVKAHLNEIPSDFFAKDTAPAYFPEEPGMELANSCPSSQLYSWSIPGMVGCHSNSDSSSAEILQNVGTPDPSWHVTSLVEEFSKVSRWSPDAAENSVLRISESNEHEKSVHEKMTEEDSAKYDYETKASHPSTLVEAEACAFGEQNNWNMEAEMVTELRSNLGSKWQSASPDDVVVPGFNLSVLKQGVLSAAELQEKQGVAEMARRKAQLLHDIDFCHQGLEHEAAHAGDLLSCKQEDSHSNTDIYDRISQLIHSCHGDSRVDDSKKNDAVLQDQESEVDSEENVALREDVEEMESMEDVSEDESSSDAECKPVTPWPEAPKQDVVQENHTTAEENEYHLQKKCQMILHEMKHGEDFQVVCAKLYSLVPAEGEQDTEHILAVVQVLVEEAVKSCELRDPAVEILSSYIDVLSGLSLVHALRHSAEKFVKLPLAKNPAYHVSFSEVLARIVTAACCWPSTLKNEVLDFTKQCLEKWVIFNKKGTQTGAIPKRLESMYVECAEALLTEAYPILQDDENYMHFLFNEMRSKVLQGQADYTIRSHLLELLLQLAGSRPQTPHSLETRGTQTSAVALVAETSKPEMVDRTTLTEQDESLTCGFSADFPLSLESSPQSSQAGPKLMHSCSSYSDNFLASSLSSQYMYYGSGLRHPETCEGADDNPERTKDASPQSDSSTGGKERSTVMSHGRARRRQILIEHLQGKLSAATSQSGSPELSPSNQPASSLENIEHSNVPMNIVLKPEEILVQEISTSVCGTPVDMGYDQHCDVLSDHLHFNDETISTPLEQPSALPPTDKRSVTVPCSPCASVTAGPSSSQPECASFARCSPIESSDEHFPPLCVPLPHPVKDSVSPRQNQNSFKLIVSDIFGNYLSEEPQQTGNCVTSSTVSVLDEKDAAMTSLSSTASPETSRIVDSSQEDLVPSDWEYWLTSADDHRSLSANLDGSLRDRLKPAAACNTFHAWEDSTAENEDGRRPHGDLRVEAGDAQAVWLQSRPLIPPGDGGDGCFLHRQDGNACASDPDDWEDIDESGDQSRAMKVLTEASEMERDAASKQSSVAKSVPESRQPKTPDRNPTEYSEDGGAEMETLPQEEPSASYEMGDLAKFSNTKAKKRKTKFRPLHYTSVALHYEETSSLAKWVPGEVMCTNCGAKGHLRYDCTMPSKSILL